jgi:hypothetical protein
MSKRANPTFMSEMTHLSKEGTSKEFAPDFGQLPLPWEKETNYLDPEFFKCDGKIVKYSSSQLSEWRVSYNPTFFIALSDKKSILCCRPL